MAQWRYELPVDYTNLTQPQRAAVREQYIKEQNGLCLHCDGDLTSKPNTQVRTFAVDHSLFPSGFFDHPIHLQHDHDTGMTEGAVHAYCNAVMWQYEGR